MLPVYSHLYFGGKNPGKCQISDECSNNERLLLDEMHILKMVVKFYTNRQAFGESTSGACPNDEYAVFCTVYTQSLELVFWAAPRYRSTNPCRVHVVCQN
jgi:hypothetical protein